MTGGLTIQRQVHFRLGRGSRKVLAKGTPTEPRGVEQGSVPRISRLMALAIRFDYLIKSGQITDQADLARLGHVARARVTQIMNLLHLAPDIQKELLFLPRTVKGHDPIRERHLRSIAAVLDWRKQRKAWNLLLRSTSSAQQSFLQRTITALNSLELGQPKRYHRSQCCDPRPPSGHNKKGAGQCR